MADRRVVIVIPRAVSVIKASHRQSIHRPRIRDHLLQNHAGIQGLVQTLSHPYLSIAIRDHEPNLNPKPNKIKLIESECTLELRKLDVKKGLQRKVKTHDVQGSEMMEEIRAVLESCRSIA
jgi:hypothetical protein